MVRKDDATQRMLDDSSEAEHLMDQLKVTLTALLNHDGDIIEKFIELVGQEPSPKLRMKLLRVGSPVQLMR